MALTAVFTSQYDILSRMIAENVHAMNLYEVHQELESGIDKLWLPCKKMEQLQHIFQFHAFHNKITVTRILHNTSVTHNIAISIPNEPPNEIYAETEYVLSYTLEFNWDFLEWQRLNPTESCPFDELRLFYGLHKVNGLNQRVTIPLMISSNLPAEYPFINFNFTENLFNKCTPGFIGVEVSLSEEDVFDFVLDDSI